MTTRVKPQTPAQAPLPSPPATGKAVAKAMPKTAVKAPTQALPQSAVKAASKPATKKAPAKPTAQAPAKSTAKAPTVARPAPAPKKEKEKKPKLVRDSFTIPKAEFAAIEALKARAMAQGLSVKKSELLRAGLKALLAMGDGAFKAALAAVPTLKTGRPGASDTAAKR